MERSITKRWVKVAGLSLALTAMVSVANAQTAAGSAAIAKGTTGALTTTTQQNFAVRVVDNKGTVKYLQSNNGITTVSNVDASGNAVTTWQLGGSFTDNTTLDLNGKTFSLNNMVFNMDATGAATTANPGANLAATDQSATTGFTILVRDEKTGNVLKMLASDLIVGGSTNVKLDATTAASDYTFTDATLPVKVAKISVYRNGVKMLGGTDYTVAGAAGSATLTVVHAGGTDPEDYAFAANDRIEIQWVK